MGFESRASVVNAKDIATKEYVDNAIAHSDLPAGYRLDAAINATTMGSYTLPVASTLILYPFKVNNRFRASDVYTVVTTASATGSYRLGLYDSNFNKLPENLIWISTPQSTVTATSVINSSLEFITGPATYQTRNINTMVLDVETYWLGFLTVANGGIIRGIGTGALTFFRVT